MDKLAEFHDVPADSFAQELLAGPLPPMQSDGYLWLVISTTSQNAGPVLAGLANPGFSHDSFAVIDDPDYPTSIGTWLGAFPSGDSIRTHVPVARTVSQLVVFTSPFGVLEVRSASKTQIATMG